MNGTRARDNGDQLQTSIAGNDEQQQQPQQQQQQNPNTAPYEPHESGAATTTFAASTTAAATLPAQPSLFNNLSRTIAIVVQPRCHSKKLRLREN